MYTQKLLLISIIIFKDYFEKGVNVLLCTDNKTVSGVTLSGEYLKAQEMFNFTYDQIVHIIDNGFNAAFLENSLKKRLRAESLYSVTKILKQEGFDVDKLAQHLYFAGVHLHDKAYPNYWGNHINPTPTLELIRSIPKTDLHCKLDGSVSLETMWSEYQTSDIDFEKKFGVPCHSLEDLKQLMQPAKHTPESLLRAKRISKAILQTKEQIERGTMDVYKHAVEDGVTYIEVVVRPHTHTKKGLTPEQVLDIITDVKKKAESSLPIRSGIVVYVSTTSDEDDPLTFRRSAEMAVKYSDRGVCGFGIYGDTDIPAESYKYYMSTFDYLKSFNFNVCIGAGKKGTETVNKALHEGGANRICGPFAVHEYPQVTNYLAVHTIPLELGVTDKLNIYTESIRTFSGNPIGMFLDNDLVVTICTFRKSVYRHTRNEVLLSLVQDCRLSIADLLRLISHGFQNNFQPYAVRKELMSHFWEKAITKLESEGYQHLTKKHYFTPKQHAGMFDN